MFKTGKKLQLLVCLTSDAFNQARAGFGSAHHVGREMPREVPKSWHYLQYGWNTCARTPIASAVESITGGDENSVTFNLFGDGSKKKKQKKKKKKKKNRLAVRLMLPEDLDAQVHKVAALVDHFKNNHGTPKLYNAVRYQPSRHERALQVPASVGVSAENLPDNGSMLKQELQHKGVIDAEMISFVVELTAHGPIRCFKNRKFNQN